MAEESLPAEYFERVYAASDDPWQFETSDYEAEKYDATLELLGDRPFDRAFEIGCSIGVLSARLASRCTELLAVDVSEKALEAARRRSAARGNASFRRMSFPRETPEGRFDLVVLSEVGYYWSDEDLALAREWFVRLGAGTVLELVHFLPEVSEYVRGGDAVHAFFTGDARFAVRRSKRAERYRIDVLVVV